MSGATLNEQLAPASLRLFKFVKNHDAMVDTAEFNSHMRWPVTLILLPFRDPAQ